MTDSNEENDYYDLTYQERHIRIMKKKWLYIIPITLGGIVSGYIVYWFNQLIGFSVIVFLISFLVLSVLLSFVLVRIQNYIFSKISEKFPAFSKYKEFVSLTFSIILFIFLYLVTFR